MSRPRTRSALHLFPTFAVGGSQARFAQIARGVPGWRHVIVPLDGDRGADAMMGGAERSYRDVSLTPSSGLSPANLAALRGLIREVRPDLLCTYNWGAIEGVIANRVGARAPHLHFEDGFGPEEATGELPRRRLVRRIVLGSVLGSVGPHVAVPSSFLEAAARDGWRVPPARLHRVDNGVDLARFAPREGRPARAAFLGALRAEKNPARLVRAANAIGAPLDVWGDGPEREALAALAGPTVTLRGATDKPEDALADAGLLALSSDTEQMPLTVLEAMAAGLPVVSTDVGDVASMVSDANRPYVTPLGDDDAYADALATLLEDRARSARIGAANRAKAEARYGLNRMTAAYGALMDRLAPPDREALAA